MIELTDEQRRFVELPVAAFVKACPGAGKTQTIAARVKTLSRHLPPRKGLAVLSFSNSAIDEICTKCRELELQGAHRHPNFIGTFDAFLRHFFIVPFGLAGVAVRPTVVDSWDAIPVQIRLRGRLAFQGAEGVSLDNFDPITNDIDPAQIGHAALRNHVRTNRRSYIDMAARRRRVLRNSGLVSAADARAEALSRLQTLTWSSALVRAVRARFQEVIVDEGQDCNPLDLQLLSWLADNGVAISVVADPDQAIYGFRHGDPADLAAFRDRYAVDHQLELTGNFRSSPAICSLAATLRLGRDPDRSLGSCAVVTEPIHLLRYEGQKPPTSIHRYFNELAERACVPLADRIILAHARSTVRHACGLAAEDAGGHSRISKVARAVGIFHAKGSSGRARETCLAVIEEDILRLMGKFQEGSTVGRNVEEHGIERRWLRRIALHIIASLPPTCDDTDDGREAWVRSLRTAVEVAQVACASGATPTRYYPLPRNSDWKRFLQADADLAATRWTTIHEAKGTQHSAVCVVIPPDRGRASYTAQLIDAWEAREELESKRVIYVGVTRARKLLAIAAPATSCDRIVAILRASDVPVEIYNLPAPAAVGTQAREIHDQ